MNRFSRCGVLLTLAFAPLQARAQEPSATPTATDPTAYFHGLEHRQVFLRGYPANSDLRYTWDGYRLQLERPSRALAFSTIVVRSARWDAAAGTFTLRGERHAVVRLADGRPTLDPGTQDRFRDLELRVHWQPGDAPSPVQLASLLFFPNVDAALAGVPEEMRDAIPPKPFPTPGKQPLPPCDCNDRGTADCEGHQVSLGLQHPTLVRSADPEMPDELRGRGTLEVRANVAVRVSETGAITTIWLAHPSQIAAVNESAVKAVSQYSFRPATCHGRPYAMTLFVDVNFVAR